MSDRPIIMAGSNVLALLDGRKTQTRRVIERYSPGYFKGARTVPENLVYVREGEARHGPFTPQHSVGDRLWVKELYLPDPPLDHEAWDDHTMSATEWNGTDRRASDVPAVLRTSNRVIYAADPKWNDNRDAIMWDNPLYMPRWASRITLTITDVRVQRLHDITGADAIAEGIELVRTTEQWGNHWRNYGAEGYDDRSARYSYKTLWNMVHGHTGRHPLKTEPWSLNPWVAAYTFTVHSRNIDAEA